MAIIHRIGSPEKRPRNHSQGARRLLRITVAGPTSEGTQVNVEFGCCAKKVATAAGSREIQSGITTARGFPS
jgi:hypothetical protein